MRKKIAYIPLSSIEKMEIRITNCRKSLSQVKQETDADYILNGGMWNPDGSPCPLLKVDGKLLSKAPWSAYGYGWDSGHDIRITADHGAVRNFVATTCIIGPDGPVAKPSYAAAQGGRRGRTAIGMAGDKLVLYCTQDGSSAARTPEELRDELWSMGCRSAVMLDSGGSSQCDFDGQTITASRKCHNYIIVYTKKEGWKMPDKTKTVCLDPGHGPGCVNGSPDGSYREYEFAWDMGQRVKRLLEARGVKVVMTKTESEYPRLTTRANVSNRAGADLFLSLHSNATGAKGWSVTRGLIVYTSMAGASAGRNIAANCVIKRMREAGVVVQGSGLQHNKSYTVLSKTNAPAMIVEYGFHTNKEDVRLLKDDAHRDKLATATAKGVCDYLGVKWETGSGLDADVDALASAGFITSPDYWKAGNYSAANVQALIRAMANYIRKDNAL